MLPIVQLKRINNDSQLLITIHGIDVATFILVTETNYNNNRYVLMLYWLIIKKQYFNVRSIDYNYAIYDTFTISLSKILYSNVPQTVLSAFALNPVLQVHTLLPDAPVHAELATVVVQSVSTEHVWVNTRAVDERRYVTV